MTAPTPLTVEGFVAPIADARDDAGGKGASLGLFARLGLPTVPGVVVSSQAYSMATAESGLAELVARFWNTDPASAQSVSLEAQLRDGVERLPTDALAEAILATLERELSSATLGLTPNLILRSSATGEDSGAASFAGQFLSAACAPTVDGISHSIRAVWASCTATHVASYRRAIQRADDVPPQMGVVVQPLLTFDFAGLAFTQHPTAQVRGWTLVEYLDEAPSRLVAGEVRPHICRVSADACRVVWEQKQAGRPVLAEPVVRTLMEVTNQTKETLGREVDVEWGSVGRTVYLLQGRPATRKPVL